MFKNSSSPALVFCGALLTLLAACNLSDPAPFTAPVQTSSPADMLTSGVDMSAPDMSAQDMLMADMSTPDMLTADMSGVDMGCVPEPDAKLCELMAGCGEFNIKDECGSERLLSCGMCPQGQVCGASHTCECVGQASCPAQGECGVVSNACGEEQTCLCGGLQTCQGESCGELELVGSDVKEKDRFGSAVLLVGDALFVGAPAQNDGRGAVYFFKRSSPFGPWKQRQKLTSSSPQQGASFGHALAFEQDTLFVGMPGFDHADPGSSDEGALEVFSLAQDILTPTQALFSPSRKAKGRFGQALASTAGDVFVGENAPTTSGSVYIYRRPAGNSQWSSVGSAKPPTSLGTTSFYGATLSASGDMLAVGASQSTADLPGSVLLFKKDMEEWEFTQELTVSNASGFGATVSLGKDHLLIAQGPDLSEPQWAVLTYTRDGQTGQWKQAQVVQFEEPGGSALGSAMAVSSGRALVGAPLADNEKGRVYSWRFESSWEPGEPLSPEDSRSDASFGHSISISADTAVIGAPGKSKKGRAESLTGTVFVIDLAR